MRSSDRWLPALGPLLLVAGPGLVATVALDLRVGAGPGAVPDYLRDPGWPYAVQGVVLAALAAIILWRHRGHPIGWALVGLAALWSLDGFAQAYLRLGVVHQVALPGATWLLWYLVRLAGILPLAVAALLLVFPSGALPGGRWRHASYASLALMAAGLALMLVAPGSTSWSPSELPPGADPDPTTLHVLQPVAGVLEPVGQVSAVTGFVLAMGSVVARYRTSRGLDRDRMRWLLWAVVAMALLTLASLVIDLAQLQWVFVLLVLSMVPVAMTVAIVEPRILPIQLLLIRTVVYGLVSAVVVAVDLLVLAGLSALVGDALAERQVVVVALVLAVVFYGPLRRLAESAIRRLVLGERLNPYGVVATLASRLESTDREEAQLAAVAESVAQAFGLSFVEVSVSRPSGDLLVASRGRRPGATRSIPITYRNEHIGSFTLPTRGVRSQLTRRDEALLGDVVRQAATAIRATHLADELQAGREHLVLAREEERRRIRRDLHDGLGPAMSAVVFRIEAARLRVADDPATDRHLLETRDLVKDVVTDIRRLVHDLRPPALDDRGLVGALRQLAENSHAAVDVRVEADLEGELPAAVEVAAFRIASEALTNTLRHARADTCTVQLAADRQLLMVRVTDDGVGIPPDVEAGVGLLSVRERATELGGTVDVHCPARGGTTVTAWLPIGVR